MYDAESIFVFQKRGILCLVKSWEIWECGGRKSVCCAQLACERDIGCDQQSSQVTGQQSSRVAKWQSWEQLSDATKMCIRFNRVFPTMCLFTQFGKQPWLLFFLSQTRKCKKSDTFWDLPCQGNLLAIESFIVLKPVTYIHWWYRVGWRHLSSRLIFLMLSHHTGDLHMHFIVSQGGQIVHISSTYSSTYNMKLLLSDLLWNVLFLYNYRPAYQRPWQPVPIKFNFHNFSRIKS